MDPAAALLPVLSNGLDPKRPEANPGDGAAPSDGEANAGDGPPKLKLELSVGALLPNWNTGPDPGCCCCCCCGAGAALGPPKLKLGVALNGVGAAPAGVTAAAPTVEPPNENGEDVADDNEPKEDEEPKVGGAVPAAGVVAPKLKGPPVGAGAVPAGSLVALPKEPKAEGAAAGLADGALVAAPKPNCNLGGSDGVAAVPPIDDPNVKMDGAADAAGAAETTEALEGGAANPNPTKPPLPLCSPAFVFDVSLAPNG